MSHKGKQVTMKMMEIRKKESSASSEQPKINSRGYTSASFVLAISCILKRCPPFQGPMTPRPTTLPPDRNIIRPRRLFPAQRLPETFMARQRLEEPPRARQPLVARQARQTQRKLILPHRSCAPTKGRETIKRPFLATTATTTGNSSVQKAIQFKHIYTQR
jgi:hypothetical protein